MVSKLFIRPISFPQPVLDSNIKWRITNNDSYLPIPSPTLQAMVQWCKTGKSGHQGQVCLILRQVSNTWKLVNGNQLRANKSGGLNMITNQFLSVYLVCASRSRDRKIRSEVVLKNSHFCKHIRISYALYTSVFRSMLLLKINVCICTCVCMNVCR